MPQLYFSRRGAASNAAISNMVFNAFEPKDSLLVTLDKGRYQNALPAERAVFQDPSRPLSPPFEKAATDVLAQDRK